MAGPAIELGQEYRPSEPIGQPRATGRAGSAHHSLHEPGYRCEPVSPACSMASRLWQAVTPEPHWCTHRLDSTPNASKAERNSAGGKEPAVWPEVVLEEAVACAWYVPGNRVQRLDLAAKPLTGARVEHHELRQALERAACRRTACRSRPADTASADRGRRQAQQSPPTSCQAARPPSSTATARRPASAASTRRGRRPGCPGRRSRRPPRRGVRPRRRRLREHLAAWRGVAAVGSGLGDDRSWSRSA